MSEKQWPEHDRKCNHTAEKHCLSMAEHVIRHQKSVGLSITEHGITSQKSTGLSMTEHGIRHQKTTASTSETMYGCKAQDTPDFLHVRMVVTLNLKKQLLQMWLCMAPRVQ